MTTTTMPASDVLDTHLEFLQLPVTRAAYRDDAKRAADEGLTHVEFLNTLVGKEAHAKLQRIVRARVGAARMPVIKTMDTWDWKYNASTIRREQIIPLFELGCLKDKSNILLLGGQGLGKTHLSLALAHAACCKGIPTLFTTAADMINRLYAATADRSLEKALRTYTRPSLLVIDEIGYLPLSKEAGDLFFQVIAKRYESGSIILSCNRAFKDWTDIFADPVVAAAIIERLAHHAQIIVFRGKSHRLKGKQRIQADADQATDSAD